MDVGSCFAERIACRRARASLGLGESHRDELTECAAQPNTTCFEVKHANGGSEQMCAPTLAMCRERADGARHRPGVTSVSECAASDPAAVPDDNTHWWCMSFAGGQLGSCSRSKVQCEGLHDKEVELAQGHPSDVTPCAGQPSAQCFDVGSADHRYMSCHPTLEICRSHLRSSKPHFPAVDDDCRAVE